MATRRSGQLKNWRTPTFIVSRRVAPPSVDECSDHGIREPRHALEVEAVLHDAGREETEPEVASRVDPEGGRSRADPAERPGAREVAEGPGDDALAADEEAETDRGWERHPAAHLHGVVEERVRLVAGPVPGGELEHRGRQDAGAVQLPSTPEHLDEPGKVAEGGDRKSTRLNSSHDQISYAVFCLKKK